MKKNSISFGFTLIELLIVIAVIAVLAGLIFPVFAAVRSDSKKAVCLSNLRQIGLAIALYAHDYDDQLPYAPDNENKYVVMHHLSSFGDEFDAFCNNTPPYTELLKPYSMTNQLIRCPMDNGSGLSGFEVPYSANRISWYDAVGSSYQYIDEKAFMGRKLSGFPSSSNNILVGDYAWFHGGKDGNDGLVNILFADLHSKTVLWTERTNIFDADP